MMQAILQSIPFDTTHPRLPIHQQPAWTSLNAPNARQRYLHFRVMDGDVIAAQGLVRLRRIAPGLSVAACQRGPMTQTPQALADVLPPLEHALKRMGAVSLTVNPAWTGAQVPTATAALAQAGYARVPRDLQNFPTMTAILELQADDDALLAAMTQTGRRHLRKAWKAGVSCRPMADDSEARTANAIMARMAEETGLVTDSQHDFRAHFAYLEQNPRAGTCLVACLAGDIFGAAVNYVEGATGYNMLIATRSDVAVPRAHAPMWASMVGLRDLGCTHFDMVGYPDPEVETDAGAAGRGAFKRAFGPQITPVLPLFTKPLRPVLHGLIQTLRTRRRQAQKERQDA